ncbi:hypothetical protein SKAU_G00380440 [Synaphobranchus kaupii]|uniref:Uncharacterized protein n=1 Tax=Synaphobranchus kaupii TaxID=118154 RepID=A0A9Q1IEM4_SYNKA|nr:hypothetical protein SKAU_G00380440 [Synaphobranchus kaupii]
MSIAHHPLSISSPSRHTHGRLSRLRDFVRTAPPPASSFRSKRNKRKEKFGAFENTTEFEASPLAAVEMVEMNVAPDPHRLARAGQIPPVASAMRLRQQEVQAGGSDNRARIPLAQLLPWHQDSDKWDLIPRSQRHQLLYQPKSV